jgi:carboxylesterase type B
VRYNSCYKLFGSLHSSHSVGDLRFRAPQLNKPYNGTYDATASGPSCIQQALTIENYPHNLDPTAAAYIDAFNFNSNAPSSEDCE